jgi:hypothetical protein
MSTVFVVTLVLHIMFGIVGTILSYASVLTLLKSEVRRKKFFIFSFSAWVGYMISWLSGGYYYWFYYGSKVKPVILEGDYAWAHKVVMEAKEHVFLILPIASLVLALIAWSSTNRINTEPAFKSAAIYLATAIMVLATFVALSGILITGGAQ